MEASVDYMVNPAIKNKHTKNKTKNNGLRIGHVYVSVFVMIGNESRAWLMLNTNSTMNLKPWFHMCFKIE